MENKKKKIIIISSVALAVVIVAVIICITVFGKNNKETSSDETPTPTTEFTTAESTTEEPTTEVESGVSVETDINVIAYEAYKEVEDKIGIDSQTYTTEFIKLVDSGKTVDEAKEHLISAFNKEQADEQPTVVEDLPEYREPVGNYTETFDGLFAVRTYENGAIRYFVFDNILIKYYPIEKYEYDTGVMPSRVYEQNQADLDKFLYGDTGGGTGGGTTSTETPTESSTNKNTEQQTQSSGQSTDSSGGGGRREEGGKTIVDDKKHGGGIVSNP